MFKIYGASWCRPCNTTKDFFDSKGIQYEYIDIDNTENIVEEKRIQSIPVIEKYRNDILIKSYVGSIENINEYESEFGDD